MESLYIKAEELLNDVSEQDIESSATLNVFRANKTLFRKVLRTLNNELNSERKRMLDLGCGYGGLAKLIGTTLGFNEVYGIDINQHRLPIAKEKGVHVYECNLEKESFPFSDNYFDLATSFGVLEHLTFFDNMIKETHRILKDNGVFLLSAPNLGSWVNRFTLLLGYQPRNLEISRFKVFGVHKLYHKLYEEISPVGHISSCTLKAIKELLEYYRFKIVECWGVGIIPSPDIKLNFGLKLLDSILSKKANLAIRFILIARKSVK
jgi:ubiquinone/menaquinone biosynthesis C-methylase UbiE